MADDELVSTVRATAATATTTSVTTVPPRVGAVIDRQNAAAPTFGAQGNTSTGVDRGRGVDRVGQDLNFTFQLPDLYSLGESEGDGSDDPSDPDPGPGGAEDWGRLGEYKPSKGEALFLKEAPKYIGLQPFDTFLRKFGHLADMCRVTPEIFKSTLFLKIGGSVGALINDMVPTKRKFKVMSGKQYAEAVRARLEPVTERRLLYQQFLSRTQQTGESIDLYLLDKFNLFKRSSIGKNRDFEEFMDQTIRGFLNAYLKEKVREACTMKTPKSFIKFREITNKQVTFIQSRLQANEMDASEGQGVEVKMYSYSYLDSVDSAESRYRLEGVVKGIKEEKVNALEEEVEDAEEGVFWVENGGGPRFQTTARGGSGRGGFARSTSAARGGLPFSSRGGASSGFGGTRPKIGLKAGDPSSGKSNPNDNCFWCGGRGHWKNECPRRNHGFKKGVFAVDDGVEHEGDEEGTEDMDMIGQIAALTAKVEKLAEFMGEGRKVAKWGKADPQTTKGDGVNYLE